MEIKVHSIHFDADQKLIDFVQQRVHKLDQFHDNIILGEVYLRLDRNHDNGNKVAEIRLVTPGKEMFAKKQCRAFEEAIDQSTEALRRQLRRKKGKLLQVH